MKKIEFDSVTTKGGDKGFTSLFDGTRVRKNSPLIIVLGSIDSLNASLGMTRSDPLIRQYDKNLIKHIQNDLYDIMAILSGYDKPFKEDRIEFLEKKQRLFMRFCRMPTEFINFGDNAQSAEFNSLRTEVRLLESSYLSFQKDPVIMQYFNRLSDLFYVLSIIYETKAKKRKQKEKNSILSKILRK